MKARTPTSRPKISTSRRPSCADAGFTLIELGVVLLLIAVIVTLAIPRLEDAGQLRIHAAIRRVAGTLQYVFDLSVFRKIPYQVHYNIESGEMWVEQPMLSPAAGDLGGGATQSVELVEVKDDPALGRVKLPSGVKFLDITTLTAGKKTEGETQTQFLPEGYAEYTLLHLQDEAGHQWTVELNPLTGKAKVRDGYYEPVETR